eukprot:jgi/Ulvmu1/6857/UM031_0062.1
MDYTVANATVLASECSGSATLAPIHIYCDAQVCDPVQTDACLAAVVVTPCLRPVSHVHHNVRQGVASHSSQFGHPQSQTQLPNHQSSTSAFTHAGQHEPAGFELTEWPSFVPCSAGVLHVSLQAPASPLYSSGNRKCTGKHSLLLRTSCPQSAFWVL